MYTKLLMHSKEMIKYNTWTIQEPYLYKMEWDDG